LDEHDVDTRTIWTGNVTRQPMLRGVEWRAAGDGLPNADAVMERGFLLPCNHGMGDQDVSFVLDQLEAFLHKGSFGRDAA
jgi:CDP-6-deoxy-D-xylo-4-hexulose-3-dehydrase